MAMAVDSRHHQAPFSNMGYETMRYQQPHFSNPWQSSAASSHGQMYATAMPTSSIHQEAKHYPTHAPQVSSAYSNGGLGAPSLATGMLPVDPDLMDRSGLQMAQDMTVSHSYGPSYNTSAAPSASTYAPTSAPQYSSSYGWTAGLRNPQ
ncbi:hypothetical protein B0A54_01601 [Friedmanniomyces endolithicus]|uniref:Uncharacterized protein n=1 Tax=Friedmanniomyces endolithicus TaxID=329885 RepID=A0A4V5NBK0_9PEZI|nr:hypothetical protein LTS09_006358 [Friedmanniomyces endolithicus]TKA48109.1 hypothetical protein B0A54_01601 [Friedmanniomyces endolithicus]